MHSLGESRGAEPCRPAPGSAPLLWTERLSFHWRGRPVLREVSLVLAPAAVVSLCAGNGAGKTTLLRLLAGALEPCGGTVRRSSAKLRVGLVGAGDRGLYARLSARANIELAVALALAPRARRERLVTAAVARFALEPIAGQRVDRLSTGQRQRVRLAIGFAGDPRVVLLDEPAAGLDEAGGALLAAALEDLAARAGSALWTAPAAGGAATLPVTSACTLLDGRLRST